MITLPIFRRPSKTPCHLTHTSQPNHLAFEVRQFTLKLFAISWKLGFTSGIRELIDAQFYGNFHLCKVGTYRLKTLLRSVWWGFQQKTLTSTMILCMFPTFAMHQFLFRLFKSIFKDRVAILAHEFPSTKSCSDRNLDRKSCFIAKFLSRQDIRTKWQLLHKIPNCECLHYRITR